MSGIWLLLWIVFSFFGYGVGIGRILEQRRLRKAQCLPKEGFPLLVVMPIAYLPLFTVEQALKAGWLPNTAAMREFLRVGDMAGGIFVVAFFTLAIAYIIADRVGRWQKNKALPPRSR